MKLFQFAIILILFSITLQFPLTEGETNEDLSLLSGHIYDTSAGAIRPLIFAKVSTNDERGLVSEARTLKNGSYSIMLKPGMYTVEVHRSNYISQEAIVFLKPNSTLTLDFYLELSISPVKVTILFQDLPDGLYPEIQLDGLFHGHISNGSELMFRGGAFHIIEVDNVTADNIRYVPQDPIFHVYGKKEMVSFKYLPQYNVSSTTDPWINNWYYQGHTIHLETRNIIYFDDSTRLIFDGWQRDGSILKNNPIELEVDSNLQIDSAYKKQYLLSISSARGTVIGEGWYDEGSIAEISTVDTEVGVLPLKYKFIGWKGDLVSLNTTATIVMDGPKEVYVEWERIQYLDLKRPDPIYQAIIAISLLIFAAKILGGVFAKFKLPEVLGELFAGIILGPYAIGGLHVFGDSLIELNEYVLGFAEIGAILLLFIAGLQISFSDFKATGLKSTIVGSFGVVIPFFSSLYVLQFFNYSWEGNLLVAATLTATSIAITLRTLEGMNRLNSTEGNIMINSAVIDDILGLVVLAVVISIVTSGSSIVPFDMIWILFRTVAFWLILLAVMLKMAPRIIGAASRWRARGTIEAFSTSICFGSAFIASIIGLSPIVGAFAAGMALASSKVIVRVRDYIDKLGILFSPIFFAVIGAQFNIRLLNFDMFWIILVLLGIAVASKLFGCGLPAIAMLRNSKTGIRIGIGMISRGEVGLIIAGIGVTSGIMTQSLYGAIVTVVILTTVITPIALKWTYRKEKE